MESDFLSMRNMSHFEMFSYIEILVFQHKTYTIQTQYCKEQVNYPYPKSSVQRSENPL